MAGKWALQLVILKLLSAFRTNTGGARSVIGRAIEVLRETILMLWEAVVILSDMKHMSLEMDFNIVLFTCTHTRRIHRLHS